MMEFDALIEKLKNAYNEDDKLFMYKKPSIILGEKVPSKYDKYTVEELLLIYKIEKLDISRNKKIGLINKIKIYYNLRDKRDEYAILSKFTHSEKYTEELLKLDDNLSYLEKDLENENIHIKK